MRTVSQNPSDVELVGRAISAMQIPADVILALSQSPGLLVCFLGGGTNAVALAVNKIGPVRHLAVLIERFGGWAIEAVEPAADTPLPILHPPIVPEGLFHIKNNMESILASVKCALAAEAAVAFPDTPPQMCDKRTYLCGFTADLEGDSLRGRPGLPITAFIPDIIDEVLDASYKTKLRTHSVFACVDGVWVERMENKLYCYILLLPWNF